MCQELGYKKCARSFDGVLTSLTVSKVILKQQENVEKLHEIDDAHRYHLEAQPCILRLDSLCVECTSSSLQVLQPLSFGGPNGANDDLCSGPVLRRRSEPEF